MAQTLGPLKYGCTAWRISSQRAADLYSAGAKLWTKEDLEDIEQQLRQSYAMEQFSVRRIDGSILTIANPMLQVQNPIWKPEVEYQEYWQLVKAQPEGPVETYLCPYIVQWSNQTTVNFRELIPQPEQVFDEQHLLWENSKTCQLLAGLVQSVLGTNTAKKVLCFGLGDFCRTAPEWFDMEYHLKKMMGCMIQHSMALTMAQICHGNASLLTQEPDYTEVAEGILSKKGFKIVGTHGAGGFAEIDEDSIVISAFVAAPVKQIIADLGRPLLIISTGFSVFNEDDEPFADADSPRTRQMWQDYDAFNFPCHPDEVEICSAFQGLHLYFRRQQPLGSQGAT